MASFGEAPASGAAPRRLPTPTSRPRSHGRAMLRTRRQPGMRRDTPGGNRDEEGPGPLGHQRVMTRTMRGPSAGAKSRNAGRTGHAVAEAYTIAEDEMEQALSPCPLGCRQVLRTALDTPRKILPWSARS